MTTTGQQEMEMNETNEQQDAIRRLMAALDTASAAAQDPSLPEEMRFWPVEKPRTEYAPSHSSLWRERALKFLGEKNDGAILATWA